MRDLSISIEGSWWDTLLYKGKLHALTPEGDWEVFDWDAIISALEASVEEAAQPALQFAFRASNAISSGALSSQRVIQSFSRIPSEELYIPAKLMSKHLLAKLDC